jgi:FkbM family methyltransferase
MPELRGWVRRQRQRRAAAHEERRWQGDARAFYGRFLGRNDLCFDVGANVGNRTAVFLALGARVVAVEPQEACAAALRQKFRGRRLEVVQAALGAAPGEAELLLAPYDTVATLSRPWMESVRDAGRFRFEWDGSATVPVTTLDALIDLYGCPAFCKIDVEGYESEVLAGLTRRIPAISFEVTPEYIGAGIECVERLHDLGLRRFAFSHGESLQLDRWLDADDVVATLAGLPRDGRLFGDVYAAAEDR